RRAALPRRSRLHLQAGDQHAAIGGGQANLYAAPAARSGRRPDAMELSGGNPERVPLGFVGYGQCRRVEAGTDDLDDRGSPGGVPSGGGSAGGGDQFDTWRGGSG